LAEQVRIALVTQFPVEPSIPHGGVEAVSVHLTRSLAQHADLEIHVVTLDPRVTEIGIESWEGARIHRLPRDHNAGELWNAIGPGRRQITGYLARLRPDVVHAHDTYGLMVKGLACPRVFTIHGFIYGDTLVSGMKWPWLRSRIWRSIETAGWADQPNIISISPYVRERLSGIARGTIHDIDNPISESFFDLKRRERAGVIFSAAAICPRKNTLRLVEAVSRLVQQGMPVELRLAGAVTSAAYGAEVRQYVHTHHLDDKVVFLGQIGTGQVQEELAAASIFALVSLEENSPMGIEEAMAAGVPVVTSNRCGMPYMVRHGESGFLVDPDDSAGIAQRMAQILSNEELAQTMSEKSRAIALDRFHPRRVATRTREVYLDIARRGT
jgi:glycosyltransferase involved in cell wall biosynthesis